MAVQLAGKTALTLVGVLKNKTLQKDLTSRNYTKLLPLIVALFLLASCNTTNRLENTVEENITVSFETESVYFTQEELVAEAELIFAGKVLTISPTRWNQDSGEYWTETTEEGITAEGERLTTTHSPWPVYEVKLSVTQPIVDEIGVGSEVVLTLLGKSPIDDATNDAENTIQVDAETVNLQIGQELIVFAMQTELAWRDPERPIELKTKSDGTSYFDIGTRSIITLMGVSDNAYLVKGSDGLYYHSEEATNRQEPISLDSLIQDIFQKRGIRQ
jgi:hypothetical protein